MGEINWMQEKLYEVMVRYLSNIQPRIEEERILDRTQGWFNARFDYARWK